MGRRKPVKKVSTGKGKKGRGRPPKSAAASKSSTPESLPPLETPSPPRKKRAHTLDMLQRICLDPANYGAEATGDPQPGPSGLRQERMLSSSDDEAGSMENMITHFESCMSDAKTAVRQMSQSLEAHMKLIQTINNKKGRKDESTPGDSDQENKKGSDQKKEQ